MIIVYTKNIAIHKINTSLNYIPNFILFFWIFAIYSEVPDRQADRNKQAGLKKNANLLTYLLSKSINEQGGIFRLLHKKLRAGWKENLKNFSKHALLLRTSEYMLLFGNR